MRVDARRVVLKVRVNGERDLARATLHHKLLDGRLPAGSLRYAVSQSTSLGIPVLHTPSATCPVTPATRYSTVTLLRAARVRNLVRLKGGVRRRRRGVARFGALRGIRNCQSKPIQPGPTVARMPPVRAHRLPLWGFSQSTVHRTVNQ